MSVDSANTVLAVCRVVVAVAFIAAGVSALVAPFVPGRIAVRSFLGFLAAGVGVTLAAGVFRAVVA